jgi:hypothetical protein
VNFSCLLGNGPIIYGIFHRNSPAAGSADVRLEKVFSTHFVMSSAGRSCDPLLSLWPPNLHSFFVVVVVVVCNCTLILITQHDFNQGPLKSSNLDNFEGSHYYLNSLRLWPTVYRPQRSQEDIPYHFKIGRPCPF